MKRSSVPNIILERLQELGEGTLDAFFPKTYSYTAIWRPMLGLDKPRKITRHVVSMNLSRLQCEGLVEKSGVRGKYSWRLTEKGRKHTLGKSKDSVLPRLQKDSMLRLVVFDIPERERRKRNLIRAELISYHFCQLQKSVWIGEYMLPQEFVSLINTLDLASHIHILSVYKHGTLYPSLHKG
ncbi:MAG: CRISPR-associated endonuclease Cas2 [Candidatus Sungbacteria bacterium]|nr:CRISPR-associated endonuclease Cas2 [Candidatus Sungbacteria bacterium]